MLPTVKRIVKLKSLLSNPSRILSFFEKKFQVIDSEQALYRSILKVASKFAPKNSYVSGRVLHVNVGLAAGGAERQVVNTLIGLKNQPLEKVSLLCEYLDILPDLDFYLDDLKSKGIEISVVRSCFKDLNKALNSVNSTLRNLLKRIPSYLALEILNLANEFIERKPEIVHAWQDSTSVKCGIAAMIVGVPRIILSSRNVPPINFAYYQSYMHPAYVALSEYKEIKFINNSEKGAKEYCKWLNLPGSHFKVLRNGVNLEYLKVSSEKERQTWRKSLGIPKNNFVVGSIFRFYPEKRPLLWVETAITVATKIEECHFVLVGDGPQADDMITLIKGSGLSSRFHFVGVQSEISLALSSMDLFLLTSEFEGTPNVLLEAQWLGIPVITLEAGGSAEAVAPEITGKVAIENEPENLANLVVQTLYDSEWREKARIEGKEFIKNRFGFERMIHETMSLYLS